jgi:hypothetical protein
MAGAMTESSCSVLTRTATCIAGTIQQAAGELARDYNRILFVFCRRSILLNWSPLRRISAQFEALEPLFRPVSCP